MADTSEEKEVDKISEEQIELCLAVLQNLNKNTDQIFEIPEEKRKELLLKMRIAEDHFRFSNLKKVVNSWSSVYKRTKILAKN